MGTILGKGFAQALVHTVNSTRAFGTRAIDGMLSQVVPMLKSDIAKPQ